MIDHCPNRNSHIVWVSIVRDFFLFIFDFPLANIEIDNVGYVLVYVWPTTTACHYTWLVYAEIAVWLQQFSQWLNHTVQLVEEAFQLAVYSIYSLIPDLVTLSSNIF